MIELLAPSGDFESLKAAVQNGCDAVYIGGIKFSARSFAGNFDNDEMIKAVKYCHSYNVKVYVTMNTLYDNSELLSAISYAGFLYEIGVDALIVQDIGFLKAVVNNFPDFEIHGSTQMTAHNLYAVNCLHSLSVKRVVLARELSLDEIKYIVKNTKAEIEIFVHGALCICFSGQCLFSSMIGGRSGNRGKCAQPCRMEYTFDNLKKAYYLSPKDLSTLEYINDIKDTGAVSLKIEGRMKRPEYVATVVAAYKRAIMGNPKESDVLDVTQSFNREGFTTAFLYNRQGPLMMSKIRGKNWGTYLGKVVKVSSKFVVIKLERPLLVEDGVEIFGKDTGVKVGSIKVKGTLVEFGSIGDEAEIYLEGATVGDIIYKSYDSKLSTSALSSFTSKDIKRVPINGTFIATKEEKISLVAFNEKGVSFKAYGNFPEVAVKTPTTYEKIMESLMKTKDTPFYFNNIDIKFDSDIVVPMSKLNELRRAALDGLLDLIQGKRKNVQINMSFNKYIRKARPMLCATTGNIDIAKALIDSGCKLIFFGGDALRINIGTFKEVFDYSAGKAKIVPWYPEIILSEFDILKKEALDIKSLGVNEALCGNMGFYSYLLEIGFNVYLDKGFNLFNSNSLSVFDNIGCNLSPELNLKRLKNISSSSKEKIMITAYGRVKLMTCKQCITESAYDGACDTGSIICNNSIHYLKDKYFNVFPVITDKYCKSHIYNSKILCAIDFIRDILSVNPDFLLLSFVDENPRDAALVFNAFDDSLKRAENMDFELLNEGLILKEKLKDSITRGHFYKGVD